MIEQKPSILIVDDAPGSLELLYEMLVHQGYHVRMSTRGKDALTLAEANPPDLILLDVEMPEMDGYEVCRRLKADETLRDVPVIFLTALEHPEDKAEGFRAGAVDYVSEPFGVAEVTARVETHLWLRELQRSLEQKVQERSRFLSFAFERVREEREKFEWVVQEAPDGYLTLDGDMRLTYANRKAREYLGLPPLPDSLPDGRLLQEVATEFRPEDEPSWNSAFETPSQRGRQMLVRQETEILEGCMLEVDILPMSAGMKDRWLLRLRDVSEA